MTRGLDPSTPFLDASIDDSRLAELVDALPDRAGHQTAIVQVDDQVLCLIAAESSDADEDWPRFAAAVARRTALSSDRLLPVVASGNDDGTMYVAFETRGAVPLSTYRETMDLSTQRCLGLLFGISRALDDAASEGAPVYAVSPESVFVHPRRGALIADLGACREALGNPPGPVDHQAPWVAPEVLEGEPAQPRSGVYAFGALTHTLLTGAPPGGEPISALRPDLPEALDAVLSVAMARKAHKRYGTASEARHLVNLVIYGAGAHEGSATRFPRRRAASPGAPSPAEPAAPKPARRPARPPARQARPPATGGRKPASAKRQPANPAKRSKRQAADPAKRSTRPAKRSSTPARAPGPAPATAAAAAPATAAAPASAPGRASAGATPAVAGRTPPRVPALEWRGPLEAPLRHRVLAVLLPVLAIAVGVAAGAVLAGGSDDPEPARPERVASDGLSVTLPEDWHPVRASEAGLAARATGNEEASLTVATDDAPVAEGEQTGPVKLGSIEAWRTRRPGESGAEVRYTIPTTSGKIVATCIAPAGAPALLASCERAASTLRLRSVTSVPLATVVEEQERWRLVAGRLQVDRRSALRRLGRASRPAGQAAAAEVLARVHRRAARRFAALPNGEASARAARGTAAAYAELAAAARRGDTAGWNAARADVRRSESELADAVTAS